jgi:hypothetical protein
MLSILITKSVTDVTIRSAIFCVASAKVSVTVHHYTTLHYTLHRIPEHSNILF